jgi:hypothetical protein
VKQLKRLVLDRYIFVKRLADQDVKHLVLGLEREDQVKEDLKKRIEGVKGWRDDFPGWPVGVVGPDQEYVVDLLPTRRSGQENEKGRSAAPTPGFPFPPQPESQDLLDKTQVKGVENAEPDDNVHEGNSNTTDGEAAVAPATPDEGGDGPPLPLLVNDYKNLLESVGPVEFR